MAARILIIEDNDANLELMRYLLHAFGHTALVACDGEEGVSLAALERPDLVLCDVQLARLDGYGVVQALKQDPVLRTIPVVAVTAFAMVGDRDKILAAGFDGYLPKPIVPETFVAQVEEHLSPQQYSKVVPPGDQTPPQAMHRPATSRSATVLLVDSALDRPSVARSTLEPYGYQLVVVRTLAEVGPRAETTPAALILLDLHLAEEEIHRFIQTMRVKGPAPPIPIVIITSELPGGLRDTTSSGATGITVLPRPYSPQILLDAVEALLTARTTE